MTADPSTSSRETRAGAGWDCPSGDFASLVPEGGRALSWLDPRPLWQSRNDRLARALGDPTNDRRRAWVRAIGSDPRTWVLDHARDASASFLVLGDTGEGDASQYALVPGLRRHADGTAFLMICSDVVYPAGGVAEYEDKFFRPYHWYPGPIYAVPGNHDWYDDAVGFMFWLCGQRRPPEPDGTRPPPLSRAWLRDRLWRRAPEPDPAAIRRIEALRPAAAGRGAQPGPYFAVDAGPVRVVGIDTGITGQLDRDQGRWLREVSAGSQRPKILVTGKPLYVDGAHRPGAIEGGGTIDEVVRAPEHRYVAVIGGDVHNYQRYPVRLGDGRTLMHLVSGGGGAFTHATHEIPNLDRTPLRDRVSEREFRCYPLRGDSLSRFSELYARRLPGRARGLAIPPDEAAAVLGERLGIEPTRPSARGAAVTARARRAADVLLRMPSRGRRGLHLPFSEWLDWNEPPLFKSFLRVDAAPDAIRIRCFAATGCAAAEAEPPIEDELVARPTRAGTWEWRLPAP